MDLTKTGGGDMPVFAFRRLFLPTLWILALAILVKESVFPARAGLRGPGKYSGVVVFDRWDTCFLLSGPYITYISEQVKNELRPYQGKAMQVEASDVFQPMNPGDALIRKYEIIGPAPDVDRWAMLDGLELTAESDFGQLGTPTFVIEIHNVGSKLIEIDPSEIGPVLLAPISRSAFGASDGGSIAVITRGNLVNPSSQKSTVDEVTSYASYTLDPEISPGDRFQIESGQSMKVRITFKASPGPYQFLLGYGGGVHEGKSLASNAISFDLSDSGVATPSR